MNKPFIIAIDGLAASGKGTLAKLLAQELNFHFLPTGNIYRLIGKLLINSKTELNDISSIIKIAHTPIKLYDLLDYSLNNEKIAKVASRIATIPEVREILTKFQQEFAANNYPGVVLEGRDIGTVVCPNANIKFFITANLEVRARRRYQELHKNEPNLLYSDIIKNMQDRDERDKNRAISPLIPAPDAIIIDNSNLSIENSLKYILSFIPQTVKYTNI
ncbi:Cytidylate kinase [Rickettsiales bacterium Ac37b]|nr:Cytidylate kinase [Rickettsiales bacterium Ac37b]